MGNETHEEIGAISRPILAEVQRNGTSSVTKELVFCSLVAVSGSCVFGSAIGYSSPTQSGIMEDLSLSVAQFSVFGSILTIRAMIGSTMNGKIADYIGRRGTMGFSEIFCIIGWLTIAFAKDYWWLYIGRLLLGYGMGVLSFVVPVYIAEITPKNLRGGFSALHALMTAFGIFMMFVVGSFVSWRALALIGIIPCLIQLVGLFFIPESPRWLAKIGRWKECEDALQHIRGAKADIFCEAAEIRDFTESITKHSEASIFELFQWKYAHSLVVGVGLMVLQQFGGINGVGFYVTSIFESAGFPSRLGTIAFVVVQLLMTTVGVVLMDKSGRKPLLMISAAGMSFGCLLTALSFLLHNSHTWPNFSPFLTLIGVLMYKGSFSIGMFAIPWLILSEVFPMNVKGSAGSLATLVSWLSSWIVSYSFNFLMDWSSSGTFFMYSSINGLTVLFVAKLVPEMKGRTLEDIHKSLNSF